MASDGVPWESWLPRDGGQKQSPKDIYTNLLAGRYHPLFSIHTPSHLLFSHPSLFLSLFPCLSFLGSLSSHSRGTFLHIGLSSLDTMTATLTNIPRLDLPRQGRDQGPHVYLFYNLTLKPKYNMLVALS